MGIAKHFHTLKISGRRIDAATLRFFGEKPGKVEVSTPAKVVEPAKPKKEEKSIGDILQNLLDEDIK